MKKLSAILYTFIVIAALSLSVQAADAAASLPSTSVWFTPANAAAGAPIVLNALVYNNQQTTATITVAFTTPTLKIGAVTGTVSPETAKTFSFNWMMPSQSTVVTATATAAVDSHQRSIPSLLGNIGTVTLSAPVKPLISGISFPGSPAISAWLTTTFTHIEAFRIKEASSFAAQRDNVKKTLGSNINNAFGDPVNYGLLLYSTTAASLFASAALFYIVLLLIILLLLRFIVNLIF